MKNAYRQSASSQSGNHKRARHLGKGYAPSFWSLSWIHDFSENAIYFVVGGVLMISFLAMKKIMNPQEIERDDQSYSYEMPRAKSEFEIQIAGRGIDRKYIGFESTHRIAESDNSSGNNGAVTKIEAKPTAKQALAKKEDPKKKTDPKKDAKKTAKKDGSRPQIKVATNAGPDRYSQKLSDIESSVTPQNVNFAERAPVTYTPPTQFNDDNEEKMTAQQWRALLFSQPTVKNRDKFLVAFRAKQVDEAAFYQITQELFSDTAADRQKAGFELYKATPSVKSFSALLSHYQETTPEPLKAQIAEVLKSYGEPSKYGVLNQLLFSSEARVVSAAQSILAQVIAKFQSQSQSTGREGRSPGSTAASPSVLKNFLAGLKRLVGSNSPAIAQQAQVLMDSILALQK